ncbi:MAG TPA: CapA family protein, partial [Dehalococcoidia bacterium]|nr:CapA family protein [Dehalococcoidia bacterium]
MTHVSGIDTASNDPWPWSSPQDSDSVTLLLAGDINIQYRDNPADALENVRATLQQADLVYGNLEGLFVESQGPHRDIPDKGGWQHVGPRAVEALTSSNIAVVGLANNVAFGPENILATIAVLDAHGVAHTGAGPNIEAAHEPAVVERKGVRFGF